MSPGGQFDFMDYAIRRSAKMVVCCRTSETRVDDSITFLSTVGGALLSFMCTIIFNRLPNHGEIVLM